MVVAATSTTVIQTNNFLFIVVVDFTPFFNSALISRRCKL